MENDMRIRLVASALILAGSLGTAACSSSKTTPSATTGAGTTATTAASTATTAASTATTAAATTTSG
jgi:hypothetical protein